MDNLRNEITSLLNEADSLNRIENLRVEYLGKNGKITGLLKNLGSMEIDARKIYGAKVNELKEEIIKLLEEKKAILEEKALLEQINAEKIDITIKPRLNEKGKIHPLTQVKAELISIFGGMGFVMKEGNSIEDDYHNFTALNIDEMHPAREMHDTFYLKNSSNMLLRTHTSSVQIRTMENGKPPFKIMSIGRTYRADDLDMTHAPMFHQIEGLVIDKNIHMGHLKSCIIEFISRFFGVENVEVRFRPSFFPFTEPSAEVDIGYEIKNNVIKLGGKDSWLEILGCGMVHPNVLKNVGIDPNEYQGFAFGMGLERICMLKYGISDLRDIFDNDIRWLKHYGFSSFDIPSLAGGLNR